jgi:hypothetical protein
VTAVYVVSEHPLLSVKAKALATNSAKEEEFAEQVALAADLLGVSETTYTGDTLLKVNRAVVLQLNYQIQLGLDPFIFQSAASDRSKQSVQYRGGEDGPSLVFPQAANIIKQVQYESGWGCIRAVR